MFFNDLLWWFCQYNSGVLVCVCFRGGGWDLDVEPIKKLKKQEKLVFIVDFCV
jgi:hypothetical protein